MTGAQVLGQEMQIALGGGDLRVAKNHRQPHDIAALPQVVGRERVAKAMPAKGRESELPLKQVEGG